MTREVRVQATRAPFPKPVTRSNAAPVGNAKAIVEAAFPGAHVTDWHRDPNSALGRANPGSWHNRTGAAVDVRPIPGVTFEQYIQGLKSRGVEIIEARDEAKHPLPHTTGPNWHVVLGQRARGS